MCMLTFIDLCRNDLCPDPACTGRNVRRESQGTHKVCGDTQPKKGQPAATRAHVDHAAGAHHPRGGPRCVGLGNVEVLETQVGIGSSACLLGKLTFVQCVVLLQSIAPILCMPKTSSPCWFVGRCVSWVGDGCVL